jgi:hypothetical protein
MNFDKELLMTIQNAIGVMKHYDNGEDLALTASRNRLLQIEQKLLQHGVMQAEASDGAEGAAVASSAVGQNGSVGCLHKRWYEFDDCVVCLDCGLKKD